MFVAPSSYDEKSVAKFWKPENVENLKKLAVKLAEFDKITAAETEPAIHQWIMDNQMSMGQLMNTLRIAILGISQGPSIFDICEFIGKDETLRRIEAAMNNIAVKQ